MAADDKRRQKKLQRKNAKRKERHKSLIKERNQGLGQQLAAAASAAPILDSFVGEVLWDRGIGPVLISRKLPNGMIAFGNFLVDTYCLGVKDAFGNLITPGQYDEFLKAASRQGELIKVSPANCRALIEGAVEYADQFGLKPHADYYRVRPILGDIDRSQADEQWEFGKDGKPYFFAGPHDSPQRCFQVMSLLEAACGPDGFHYMMPISKDTEILERLEQ